jgi:aspartate aminotransferase
MAQGLTGSEIIRIAGLVNEAKKQGKEICNLTIGDFDSKEYPIPALFKEEIKKAYDSGETNYPPANGVESLRKSILSFIDTHLNLKYNHNEVMVSGGSRPLIYTAYQALVDAGDKVVFPVPSWNNNHYCHITGAETVMVLTKPENYYMPTAEELRPLLKDAQLLSLCSPLNPTGTMFEKEELRKICEMVLEINLARKADEKPLYILYDQIYWMLTFGNNIHHHPLELMPELKEYTLYIDGLSKCFASTGVRVGYAYGPEHIIERMKAILGHLGAWAPKAEQVAAAKMMDNQLEVDKYMNALKVKVAKSLNLLHDFFKSMKNSGLKVDAIEPMGAIYLSVLMDFNGRQLPTGELIQDAKMLNEYLIQKAGVAFVPFSSFGNSTDVFWYRISVGGCSYNEIETMLPRLEKALKDII